MEAPRAANPRTAAIDGLRGLALLGMLLWHAQVGWIQGGFARMTIFFVLAGFLSTRTVRRLAAEPTTSGVRAFGRFWGRRIRRLLPLTLLGVALATWVTAAIGGSVARDRLWGDAVSVVTSWSNWRFIFEDRSYGAFFESPSAFQHFWSLSAEEQCFLLLPVVVAVAVAATRGRHRPLVAVLAGLGAFGCALPLLWPQVPDVVYYGTHVRLGEFLVGASLAVAWERVGVDQSARSARAWAAAGAGGLALLLGVMLLVDREQEWIYRGGMGLVTLPVVAVLGGVLSGGRVVRGALALPPLVWLGRAALSVYALHWPVYQVVESELAGRPHHVVVLVELVAGIALGAVVHVVIERPLLPDAPGRVGRLWRRPRVAYPTLAVAAAACLVVAAAVPPVDPPIAFDSLASDPAATATLSVEDATAVLTDGVSAVPALPVIRDRQRVGVGLFGGSTALTIALGGDEWSATAPWAQLVPGYAPLGCGLLDEGDRAHRDPGTELPEGPVPPECTERSLRWDATAVAYEIAVPVIVASSADLTTWRLPGEDVWRTVGDPVLDERIATGLVESIDGFVAAGAQHVVLTTPVGPPPTLDPDVAEVRRARLDRYAEIVRQVATVRDVTVVDLSAWSRSLGRREWERLLPDGIHTSPAGATVVWNELLGPALAELHATRGLTAPA